MPRSYFRTLPDLYERKAFGTDTHPPYPAAALACFVGVLCFGEQQNPRGRFKSRRMLEALIEGPGGHGRGMARQVGFLIAQGDLSTVPDGSLYIEGWDELQEGNWQVAERMQRYRARDHTVTPTVTAGTVTASRLNGGPVTDDPSRVDGVRAYGVRALRRKGASRAQDGDADGSLPHVTDAVAEAWMTATGRSVIGSGEFAIRTLDDLCERQGEGAVLAAIPVARGQFPKTPSPQQLAAALRNRLEPLPKGQPEEIRPAPPPRRPESPPIDEVERQRILRELTGARP